PLNANEIAQLISVPLVVIVWRCVCHAASTLEIVSMAPLLGIIWLTGTRTGLAVLVLAFLLLSAMAPRFPTWLASLSVLSIPAMLFVAFMTPLLSSYATR